MVTLGLAGAAVCPPLAPTAIVYIVAATLAFESSLGFHGYLFPSLREWLLPYRGLRVPARFGMLVALFLAILAGYGFAKATLRTTPRIRWIFAVVLAIVAVVEAGRTPPLTDVPTRATQVDRWLHDQPPSAVVELPLPPPGQPFQESEGPPVYHSVFHWQKLLNGTSGFFPPSYLELLNRMASFPDAASLEYLQQRRVRYVVARQSRFDPDRLAALGRALAGRPEIAAVWRFPSADGYSLVFELTQSSQR
jgi:hypothetical protein